MVDVDEVLIADDQQGDEQEKKPGRNGGRGAGFTITEDVATTRSFIATSENSINGANTHSSVFKAAMVPNFAAIMQDLINQEKLAFDKSSDVTKATLQPYQSVFTERAGTCSSSSSPSRCRLARNTAITTVSTSLKNLPFSESFEFAWSITAMLMIITASIAKTVRCCSGVIVVIVDGLVDCNGCGGRRLRKQNNKKMMSRRCTCLASAQFHLRTTCSATT